MSAIATASRWDDAPLGALIDYIVATFHRPLPDTLLEIEALAKSAFGVALADAVAELRDLLVEHMHREEELVFPWLRRRSPNGAGLVVNLLEHEHGDTFRRVRAIHALVDDRGATAPRSLGVLKRRLRELELVLGEHIRLENEVLFPRALAADRSLS